MSDNAIKVFTGNSHPELAKLVASRIGIDLAKAVVMKYSNQVNLFLEKRKRERGKNYHPIFM
jgi:phosphoribosylpyrophosphate synthetase